MPFYRCPTCIGSSVRRHRLPKGYHPLCRRCGLPLRRVALPASGPLLAIGVALLGIGLAALPDLMRGAASLAIRPSPLPRLLERFEPAPSPEERPLALLERGLHEQLQEADLQWIPSVEPLPGGGVRYVYKRRLGDPELTIAQIRSLITTPPAYDRERQAIDELLQTLQQTGIRILLTAPVKPGAAGEWDPGARMMRIKPEVVDKGTVEFAKVLNHEAIHVAQSCAAGRLRASPTPLGLPVRLDPELDRQLRDPLYAGVTPTERLLEREAYANQDRLGLGASLVRQHCERLG